MGKKLPFEVGQYVEARSFIPGYRGAWFRCRVRNISKRKKRESCELEFFDFPDEKFSWTQLFKKSNGKTYVMIRPKYPRLFHQCELPQNRPNEVMVSMNVTWKVGDAIDWWTTSSFWSGWITEVLDSGNYQVALWPPPDGEGQSYVASGKDFRPTLEWSPASGWILPEANELFRPCGSLIQPPNVVDEVAEDKDESSGEIDDACVENGSTSDVHKLNNGFPESNNAQSAESSNISDLESAVLDIVDLLHRVKWMKRHLSPAQ